MVSLMPWNHRCDPALRQWRQACRHSLFNDRFQASNEVGWLRRGGGDGGVSGFDAEDFSERRLHASISTTKFDAARPVNNLSFAASACRYEIFHRWR